MVRRLVLVLLAVGSMTSACTQSGAPTVVAAPSSAGSPSQGASDSPSPATPEPSAESTANAAGIKAAPTVFLPETDEFGIVVRTVRADGRVSIDIDRVDMLSGDEGERAAAADGQDYSNDYYLVNDNPRTRRYVLGTNVKIWLENVTHPDRPGGISVSAWLDYLRGDRGREDLWHLDVERGVVIGIEEQYRP
jgi:hypothetical protein